ncbi:Ion channel [Oesophagostomum dentatum]|uniref:Ion channel n=1 Tax=Oesophagostomum dentatum TaxID=61180 RepID=A0A0B1S5H0_OESDE|nr:Ion channel [Oesophagostomum dentatum]
MDSLLFAFTVITTIGYGNVAPKTFAGRLFVIVYGFIGIPFTLLAIADLGKFLSEVMSSWSKTMSRYTKRLQEAWATRVKLKGRYESTEKVRSNGTVKLQKSQSREEIVSLEEGKV